MLGDLHMHADVIVTSRFRGPPTSGNGGYVAGLLGAHLAGPSRVRLHVPPPLERPLALDGDGELRLTDGEALIATCTPAALDLEPPAPPSVEEAREASRAYVGLRKHPFPACFVCGPERTDGDGLRIFPGRTRRGLLAAPFEPPRDLLVGQGGRLELPIVWAALDCTGYFAIVGDDPLPMLLGELTVEVRGPVDRGPHVVYGWPLGGEGRKARCGTALASADGRLLAVALATWIRPKESP
jgi:hypothetical protein